MPSEPIKVADVIGDVPVPRYLYPLLRRLARPQAEGGLGDLPLDRLDAAAVRARLDGVSGSGARVLLAALRHLTTWAYQEGLISVQAVDEIRALRLPRTRPMKHERPYTLDELRAISAELPDELRQVPLLALATGLRAGELFALSWTDLSLDDDRAFVEVRRALDEHGEPKVNERGERRVPLSSLARAALADHPRLDEERVFVRRLRDGSVKPMTTRAFADAWRCACARAGVERRSFYTIRRTFAAFNLAAGVPLAVLARWMGVHPQLLFNEHGHFVVDYRRWLPWPDGANTQRPIRRGGYLVRQRHGWAVRWRELDPVKRKYRFKQRGRFATRHDASQWLARMRDEAWRQEHEGA